LRLAPPAAILRLLVRTTGIWPWWDGAIGRSRMTLQTPRSFNSWLRGQLKEKKMSQRQLALQSGVDHSTISRLIKGDRMPSLGTATRLARGLREIREETEGPAYFATLATRQMMPTTRVEYALRGDDVLSETDVRELMQTYIGIRARRMRVGRGEGNGTGNPNGIGGVNGLSRRA
jgi:Helix-turn-helix.